MHGDAWPDRNPPLAVFTSGAGLRRTSMADGVRFPDIPLYRGWGAPHRIAAQSADLEISQGTLPRELAGTLYRCGPDRQYPSLFKDDIFIDGEGMTHMFRIADGHADY